MIPEERAALLRFIASYAQFQAAKIEFNQAAARAAVAIDRFRLTFDAAYEVERAAAVHMHEVPPSREVFYSGHSW